jgi:hypothetical protein
MLSRFWDIRSFLADRIHSPRGTMAIPPAFLNLEVLLALTGMQ